MYYIERTDIYGVIWCRTTPDGEWRIVSTLMERSVI